MRRGERGTLGFSGNVFFIVEWLGRGSPGVIKLFTNSWEGALIGLVESSHSWGHSWVFFRMSCAPSTQ
jgi:hypothetical protein